MEKQGEAAPWHYGHKMGGLIRWGERKTAGACRALCQKSWTATKQGAPGRPVRSIPSASAGLNLGHVDGLESFGAFAHLELHLVILF